MEEIKRFRSSRRGFRAHLSRIVGSIQRIVERKPNSPLSDADIASLSDFREQLMCKKEILVDLDAKIANFINKEDELEAEIFRNPGDDFTASCPNRSSCSPLLDVHYQLSLLTLELFTKKFERQRLFQRLEM